MADGAVMALILAAGEGTRMRSSIPKVLHRVAGLSLLGHVLRAAAAARVNRVAVVVGPESGAVEAEVRAHDPAHHIAVQAERRGTAHAVLAARPALEGRDADLLVLFGDTPLVRPETLERLSAALAGGAAVAVLGFEAADPTGYGRVILEAGAVRAIREERDASAAERALTLCNGGLMGLAREHALELLSAVTDRNAKGEFYLTDVVEIARSRGFRVDLVRGSEEEVQGVNTRAQLAQAEAAVQRRLRAAALEAGATLVAPDTVQFSFDTVLAPDVVIEPFVVFGPGVRVEEGALIRSFSHIEQAAIGPGAQVGPYARLRPGTRLGPDVHIGNFVELKGTDVAAGAKINHLSYVGDSSVGAKTNIGAGTVTCNYDGYAKHRTTIGADAFIGTHTSLIAPVSVGDGAYIGTGSVITEDVPADALAIARERQVTKPGRGKEIKEKLRRAAGK